MARVMPYGHTEEFPRESLTVDEWDRFHGRTSRGVPFVLSRSAQSRFFETADEYDDESVTVRGQRIEIKPWLQDNPDTREGNWWSDIYRNEEPRWELNAPHPSLPNIVPQLKLQRLRILVPGAGSGNDAAWFAEQGHIVTAIDFSDEAISRAQEKYGRVKDLKFVKADFFNLPSSFDHSFDLIFEHTFYCAVTPSRRPEVAKIWRRLLADHGHMLGIFFTFDKSFGPPYGGSEWEVRARLAKSFRHLYWMRLRDSLPKRAGQELFIYSQKLSSF